MLRQFGSLTSVVVIAATILTPTSAQSARHQFDYITMSDGTSIAISIVNASPANPKPVLFHMDGYAGGGYTWSEFPNTYTVVHASVRGTGCSGGKFNLFDRRHAWDGHEIITWLHQGLEATELRPAMPKPDWSNGRIGIFGHSYPGLTGWMVATTQPPGLEAIAVSGLIDDLYRGITYPGGIPNYGFPVAWTGALRPAAELNGSQQRFQEDAANDPTCARNIATRPPRDPMEDAVVQLVGSSEDSAWYQIRSNGFYVDKINAPIHLITQYQDEQTGPRGAHTLFERISEEVDKRLIVTNGNHLTFWVAQPSRREWFNCYLRDICTANITDQDARVQVYFDQIHPIHASRAPYTSNDWPLPETEWTRLHLCPDEVLSAEAGCEGSASYVSTPQGRQTTEQFGFLEPEYPDGDNGIGQATFAGGPDSVSWDYPIEVDTAIAGPMALTLQLESTAPVTDIFVDVLDVNNATGEVSYLQRGLLRSSHRALNPHLSDCVTAFGIRVRCDDPDAVHMYRPHHPHTNTTSAEAMLTPLTPVPLQVEIFPVGHVFRAGHSLRVSVHAPPVKDPISSYAWVSDLPPAINTIHMSEQNPSSLLVPFVPAVTAAYYADPAPACGEIFAVPCFKPTRL